ncbi:MAG: exodeoxyribonuclease VII large subunit [Gemmatimonadales bacterium]|nr:MAG: exodeoxyribonuclease VII large subunit [Gemmatimonadales bacterium]
MGAPMSGDEPLDLFTSAPEPEPPEPDRPQVWDVSEINAAVRTLLEDTLPPVWIRGEVANWTRARSGHCYFTLKDDRAQIRCVMWKARAAILPVDPEEGMRIRVFGTLTLYEARGEYQIGVRELQGEGEDGLWKLAFERLRRQLADEGMLDPDRKRAIPRFPTTVGIVTSPTGAALRDILTVLRRRAPWTRVLIRGARVQGQGASSEVARALKALTRGGQVDVVIVGRGGGSIEDLWAFNEEPIARAIAECPVPVISAVGHETDVTIADLVADLRAPTPSAGAEAAVQDSEALRELLRTRGIRMARGLRGQLDRRRTVIREMPALLLRGTRALLDPRRQVLESRSERLVPAVRRLLGPAEQAVSQMEARLARSTRGWLDGRRQRLGTLAAQVEALSPLSTLARGYAVPLTDDGQVLRHLDEFHPGAIFQLRVVDGRVRCHVDQNPENRDPFE